MHASSQSPRVRFAATALICAGAIALIPASATAQVSGTGAAAPAGPAAPVYTQALGIGLEAWPYPYPVSFLPLQVDGQQLRMAYMDVAPSGLANGHTVVLLHGKNFGSDYWRGVIAELSARGYRVVAPDQIGFGKSSKPDIDYSFDLLSRNTLALLDALHLQRIDLLGHSTGGMLAIRFALTYPQRVERLLLEDPIGLEDYRRTEPPQTLDTWYRQQLAMTPASYRRFFHNYFAHWRPAYEHELVEPYARMLLSGEYPRLAKASALTYLMIYRQPVVYELPDLRMPTLIVVGAEDHTAVGKQFAPPQLAAQLGNFPKIGRAAAQAIPLGQFVEIENAGHIPHLEQPAQFYAAIEHFLAQPAAPASASEQ
jgi:pimeloyl-ACP methyl ester carboxylesterase